MYPRRGPSTIFLFDLVSGEIYECEVTWRTDSFIGVRFLDVLGPGRRRRWRAGEEVPIKKSTHRIIQLDEPPKENLLPGPPPGRLFLGVEQEPSSHATPPACERLRLRVRAALGAIIATALLDAGASHLPRACAWTAREGSDARRKPSRRAVAVGSDRAAICAPALAVPLSYCRTTARFTQR